MNINTQKNYSQKVYFFEDAILFDRTDHLTYFELYYDAKEKNNLYLEMNGIAYNKNRKTFFITGKMCTSFYEIKLIDKV